MNGLLTLLLVWLVFEPDCCTPSTTSSATVSPLNTCTCVPSCRPVLIVRRVSVLPCKIQTDARFTATVSFITGSADGLIADLSPGTFGPAMDATGCPRLNPLALRSSTMLYFLSNVE